MRIGQTRYVLILAILGAIVVAVVVVGEIAILRVQHRELGFEPLARRAGVERRIAYLDLADALPETALGQLGQLGGVQTRVSDNVPGAYAAGPERPTLRAHLHNVKFSTALALVTSVGAVSNSALSYELAPDGTVVLVQDWEADRIVRTYEVGDLRSNPGPLPKAEDPLQDVLAWAMNGGRSQQWNVCGRLAITATRREHARVAAALHSLRQSVADPDFGNGAEEALGREVGPIHMHEVAPAAVIDALADQAGVNVLVDWDSLPLPWAADVPGGRVSVDMGRLPLGAALELLFRTRARWTGLACAADEDTLIVSGRLPIEWRQARAYDLRDVAADLSDYWRAHEAHAPGPPPASAPDYRAHALALLKALAEQVATPDVWRENGGIAGLIAPSGDRLLVVAPAASHRELRRAFASLRQFALASHAHPPARARFLSGGEAVFARLETPIKELSLDHDSLSAALTALEKAAGLTICVDPLLDDSARVPTRPLTLRLLNVPLRVALREVLRAASGPKPLGYGIDRDVIVVTPDSSRSLATRIYDVRDIAEEATVEILPYNPNGMTNVGGFGPSFPATTSDVPIERLMNVIRHSIDEKSWKGAGGNSGAVRNLAGWLVITQTPENQMKIESLLNALRTGAGGGEEGIEVTP